MPRITAERREANRAEIVAAARRCFSRDGFHRTSMPDIAAEAGLSTGASYRYFSGKDALILEIAADAFALLFDPIQLARGTQPAPSAADLVAASVEPLETQQLDAAGKPVPVEELLRCAVQAWSELLRNDDLHERAQAGFDQVRKRIAAALRAGRKAGTVRASVSPDRSAGVIIALLHGFVLQRVAFGLDDTAGFVREVRALFEISG